MRYINHHQFDPRYIIDTHRTFEQAVGRHRTLLSSLGVPITVFHRNSEKVLDVNGFFVEPQSCYCTIGHDGKRKDPDPNHILCYGTGTLPGYERFGHSTNVLTLNNQNITMNNVSKTLDVSKQQAYFSISGTSLQGEIIVDNFPITSYFETTYFKILEQTNPEENRVEYYYSIDLGINWIEIPVNREVLNSPVVDISVFPQDPVENIQFRVLLRKRFASSSPPKFTYFKYQYRNQYNLNELDDRFREIDIPATLSSHRILPMVLKQRESGLTVENDPVWWSLPDSKVKNGDVILFLMGHHKGRMFVTSNTETRTYGKYGLPLSIQFNTKLIRDESDALGLSYYLADSQEFRRTRVFETFNTEGYFPSELDYSRINYKNNQPGTLTNW